VKYKDVAKNLYTQVFDDEEAAIADAQEELQRFEGDAAIVTELEGTSQQVVHRVEWAKAGVAKAKAGGQ
jgi:hypothetical protein